MMKETPYQKFAFENFFLSHFPDMTQFLMFLRYYTLIFSEKDYKAMFYHQIKHF